MNKRVIAIGDIHGCAQALRRLIEEIDPQPADTLIILGDCVDRGPDSCGVIEQLLDLRERCELVLLLGNHEEMMLNYLSGTRQPDDWLRCGGQETLDSYQRASDPDRTLKEHAEFIKTWADFWENDSHFFCHGSYEPDIPLHSQRWPVFRWQSLRGFVPEPHVSGKTAIVGHTSQKDGEIMNVGHLIIIDTFCCGGNWLTALDTTSGQVWQANTGGQVRDDNES